MAVQDGNCEEIQLVVPSIHGVIEEICEPEILSLRSAGSAFDDCQRFELLIWTGTSVHCLGATFVVRLGHIRTQSLP